MLFIFISFFGGKNIMFLFFFQCRVTQKHQSTFLHFSSVSSDNFHLFFILIVSSLLEILPDCQLNVGHWKPWEVGRRSPGNTSILCPCNTPANIWPKNTTFHICVPWVLISSQTELCHQSQVWSHRLTTDVIRLALAVIETDCEVCWERDGLL